MRCRTKHHLVIHLLCLLVLVCTPTVLLDGQSAAAGTPQILLPRAEKGLRFAVIGDSGTGGQAQDGIGRLLAQCRRVFPFDVVLMLGDNLYGSEGPLDYERKFERPYKELLDGGVTFRAALGNHDDPLQAFYKPFNMNGSRFYTFQPQKGIRFFALDSTYMSTKQLEWLEKELSQSDSDWKVCFFHHPIYSSGKRHGSDVELRAVLEPLFVKYSVDVVFSGHEHFYERLKPQNGIAYFISGAAGKLRSGNIADGDITVKGFDKDYSFMLIELVEDEMHFQTIALSGNTVDHGSIRHREAEQPRNRSELYDALLATAAKGDTSLLRDLIDQGVDVNVRDTREWSTYGFTALMWAAMEGHHAAARLLLDSGAAVDAGDLQDGATALMRAADANSVETARLLLERGADVSARDRHGYTVLMEAAEQGYNRIVELLLRHGGEVNARHRIDGTDALMLAADEGHLSTLKILLAAGADARAGDSDGRTALMRAVEIDRADIVSALVEAQAEPNQADCEGETALQEAIEGANPELLHVLRNADIDRRKEHESRDGHHFAR